VIPSADPLQVSLPQLTGPQIDIIQIDTQPERCWDVEGAARSAKSWGIGFWIWKLVYQYPGIQIFYCRYKDDDLKTLRDVWAKVSVYFPGYLHPKWNTDFDSWDYPNGSRVYVSSLKVSEAADAEAVHGKYKGKTIAVVIIEEAQEVPKVNYDGLKERLSQSRTPDGTPFRYPLKIVLVHNSIDNDHWIAEEFPLAADGDTCTREGHQHIRADLYSNQHNLGPDVMAGFEFDFPQGNPLRHTKIEGKRGVNKAGDPVYGPCFRRPVHVHAEVKFTPYYPIIEGWDFGEEKPAVVWWQYLRHRAAIRILGAVKGSDLFLELFAPKVLEIRHRLFPHCKEFLSWCDPTGATGNGGLQYTPVQLLHDLGIPARPCKESQGSRDGNDAEVRYKAIQTIAGYMLKTDFSKEAKPAFRMAPLCIELTRKGSELIEQSSSILVTAFEAGYVWDDKAPSDAHPNIRKPKKRTRYDDLMNALEYGVIGEGIPIAPSVQMLSSATAQYQTAPQREALAEQISQARQLRLAQRDHDPSDRPRGRGSRRGVL
jgi:hypothetical protein